MGNPILNVPGVDPADIECRTDPEGRQLVMFKDRQVAFLNSNGPVFDSNWSGDVRDNCQKIMNAAIDHWRATGRLFPEPPPEPVPCVCGEANPPAIGFQVVSCLGKRCFLRAGTVEQWNVIQAALRAAKSPVT